MDTQNASPMLSAPLIRPIALFKYTWQKYSKYWRTFTAVIILPYSVILIGNALLVSSDPTLILVGFLLTVVGFIYSIAAYPVLVRVISALDADGVATISVKDEYSLAFKMFWSFVLVSVIEVLAILGGGIALIIPGIVLAIYVAFAVFALILDNKKGFSAFTESFTLVYGRWWGAFGRIVLITVVNIVFLLFLLGIRFLVASIFDYHFDSSTDVVVSFILQVIFVLFYVPFMVIYHYKLYRSLKESSVSEVPVGLFRRWLSVATLIGGVAILTMILMEASFIVSQLDTGQWDSQITSENTN